MAHGPSDPPNNVPADEHHSDRDDQETSAAQDLTAGLSLLMSAASKALSSIESRSERQRGRSTEMGFSADELAELVDKGGRRILEFASQVVTDLGALGRATPPSPPGAANETSAVSGPEPRSRGQRDE